MHQAIIESPQLFCLWYSGGQQIGRTATLLVNWEYPNETLIHTTKCSLNKTEIMTICNFTISVGSICNFTISVGFLK